MSKTIIDENINIDLRPAKVEIPGTTDITLGDLHSNAIKLLYFLVRHGICDISDEHYARLVQIYRTPQDLLTKDLLDEYNTLIAGMAVINHDVLVRLIGDELGDRGSNDYFVIKILQKLSKDKAKLEILLSNHGVEFVEAYERFVERKNKFETTLLDNRFHAPSLQALANLVERGLVDAQEIFEFVNSSYKPSLKAISYTLDPAKPGITIFSHAGVGLTSIKALAKKFEVKYQDGTDRELAATIDNINECFAEYVLKDQVHTLLDPAELYKGYAASITYKEENALEFIMWNRGYNDLDRPVVHANGYPVSFAHGHDKNEATRDNIYVLDSDLGKAAFYHEGPYISLVTDELQLPRAPREPAERAAAELTDLEQAEAERVAAERAAHEQAEAERVAAEIAALEQAKAERVAAEIAALEQAEAERVAAEIAALEQAEAERVAAEIAALEQAEAERVAAEIAAHEQAEAERVAAERAALEQAEAERVAAEIAAHEQAEAEGVAAERATLELAELDRLEAERIARTPEDELDYQTALGQLKALKAQRHDARLDVSFDALVAKIEHLKQEGKVATPALTTALNKTHSRLTGELTHELYSEYANTVQGKSSLTLKILGGLMLALSITAVVLGVVFFPAVVGLAGAAAAAVSLSLTGTAATVTAGVTVATTSALFAGGGLGFFALSRPNGLSEAMHNVEQAQVQIDAQKALTAVA